MISLASRPGFPGGTSTPAPPSRTSCVPPTAVATTGRRAAMASRRALDIPSAFEGRTKTSMAASGRRTSASIPVKRTISATPSAAASRASAARSGPAPTMTTCGRSPFAGPSMVRAARRKCSCPLRDSRRPTVPTTGRWGSRPSARFASASDGPFPNRATSTPLGMSAQRAAIPCASPSRRSASAFTTMVSTRRATSRQARRARGSSPVRLRLLANTSGTRASRAAIAPTSAGRHW